MPVDLRLVGKFVWIPTLGPGKILSVEANRYKIEYFYSPWKKQTISQSALNLAIYELPPRTRVYVDLDDGWKAGQIRAVYRSRMPGGENEYEIEFLHRSPLRLPEKYIFCRCLDAYDAFQAGAVKAPLASTLFAFISSVMWPNLGVPGQDQHV